MPIPFALDGREAGVDVVRLTQEILGLTRAMVKAAQESRWTDVQDQQGRREQLLERLNFQGLSSTDHSLVVARLEELAALNSQLVMLGTEARERMGESTNLLERGRKANLAYNGMK